MRHCCDGIFVFLSLGDCFRLQISDFKRVIVIQRVSMREKRFVVRNGLSLTKGSLTFVCFVAVLVVVIVTIVVSTFNSTQRGSFQGYLKPGATQSGSGMDDSAEDDTINPRTGNSMFSGMESPAVCKGHIRFPSTHIVGACEGYYSTRRNQSEEERLPFPQSHKFPFCGLMEWARRLHFVERIAAHDESADVPPNGIRVQRQRGLSQSRMTGMFLGNREYMDMLVLSDRYLESHDTMEKHFPVLSDGPATEAEVSKRMTWVTQGDTVCWTGDFREHYVLEYNVVPSEEFYQYVLVKYEQLQSALGGS